MSHYPRFFLLLAGSLAASLASASPAPAPAAVTRIELSHQLDEERAARLEPLIEAFNNQNKGAQVVLVRRVEGDAPKHLNLVNREDHARLLAAKARFRPIHEIMREAKQPIDASRISPELRDGMLDAKGQVAGLPLAFATPVLYINRAAFRKAGLNPDAPPKSWAEVQDTAGKLYVSGSTCPFTTSWPAWVHVDNMSAWNGADVSDGKGQLAINGLVQIKHVAMLATWYKAKYFSYFGRRDEADRRFAAGECAMLTSSSWLYSNLSSEKGLDFGVAQLPFHDDVYGAPKNTLADGLALWAGHGLKREETRAVAGFVNYVLGPEVQIEMTVAGGFLPMTSVARAAAGSKLLKGDVAALQVSYGQLQGRAMNPMLRVSQTDRVRLIVEEELESVWEGRKPAKEALDHAVRRGNAVMVPVSTSGKKRS